MRPSSAPEDCLYCGGKGWRSVEREPGVFVLQECGFCDNGKPLDNQEDWDRSWGRIFGSEATNEETL